VSADAGERLQRILRFLPLVAGRDAVSLDEVHAAAGVDARTLLDDLRALTERDDEPGGFVEAVSILFGGDSVSVRTPHFGRPTRITLPELCALELGLAMLAGSSTAGGRMLIARARARIREAIVAMPATAARDDLWFASGPRVPNEDLLELLRSCVVARAKVGIAYRRGDGREATERVVHPYAVLPMRGKWFLIGHCERAGALRFFRVDRIESAEETGDSFEPPADFDLQSVALPDRPLVSASAERLVVKYSPRIARWIGEREEGTVEADGSLVVSHPLADDAWAVRHVLQYGPDAVVLEPARVRERVAATLRRMAELSA
jgi:proteasome accessory factor C